MKRAIKTMAEWILVGPPLMCLMLLILLLLVPVRLIEWMEAPYADR
jgi:hypothetical protein